MIYILLLGEVICFSRSDNGNATYQIDEGLISDDFTNPRGSSVICTMRSQMISISIKDYFTIQSEGKTYIEEALQIIKLVPLFSSSESEFLNMIADTCER
jgi:hypothetical protein